MPVATILAGAVHQPVDLALGEIASLDCQVYDGWSAFPGPRFHRNKAPIVDAYWLAQRPPFCPPRAANKGRERPVAISQLMLVGTLPDKLNLNGHGRSS